MKHLAVVVSESGSAGIYRGSVLLFLQGKMKNTVKPGTNSFFFQLNYRKTI